MYLQTINLINYEISIEKLFKIKKKTSRWVMDENNISKN